MDIGTAISVVSIIWLVSEVSLALFRRAKSSDLRRDESSQKIIWVVIATSLPIGIFFGFQRFGHFGIGSKAIAVVGIALIVLGIAVRWLAILTLKRQFTVDVAIIQDHQLVTHGIYRYVRHPIYSGLLMSFLGVSVTFASYVSLIVIFVPICAAFLHRIVIEERVLKENFGQQYLQYCSSTKRLIPFIY